MECTLVLWYVNPFSLGILPTRNIYVYLDDILGVLIFCFFFYDILFCFQQTLQAGNASTIQVQHVPKIQTVTPGTTHVIPQSTPEEQMDLEELEQFAKTFKQRRIKLGFTQVGSLCNLYY